VGLFFNVVVEANNDSKKRRVWSWGTMNYVKDKKSKTFVKQDELSTSPEILSVMNKRNVIQIAAGDAHAVALTLEGDVFTWGIYKQKNGTNLGYRSNAPKEEFQDEPELVETEEPIVQIGCTSNKTIALTESGDVYEWGETSLNKRVVSRHTKDSLRPSFVPIPKKVCQIFCSSGGEQVFAVSPDGHVFCWGYDKYYQLGIHSSAFEIEKEKLRVKREEDRKVKKEEEEKKMREEGKEVPEEPKKKVPEKKKMVGDPKDPKAKKDDKAKKEKKVPERKSTWIRPTDSHAINQFKVDDENFKIKKICGGSHHTVLLDDKGNVYTWGRNQYGQLGLKSNEPVVKEPTKVDLDEVVDVSCGANHTLFLTKEGSVYGCGLAKDDRFLSKENHVNKPIKIEGLDKYKIIGISSGKRHNMLLAE